MAERNGTTIPETGERRPLLGAQRNIKNGSQETARRTSQAGGEEQIEHGKANQQVGLGRGSLIVSSLMGLILLQAANMSVITTTQSQIAEDLEAYTYANWFTAVYLIAMSSTAPLAARLAQIFSPRICVLVASIFFAIGGVFTSLAPTWEYFLTGRGITGLGAAGIMTISVILVLELSPTNSRGLFIGLLNAGFTIGVSFGAVVAGALLPITGWRFLFWIQGPLAFVSGVGIFFSIPSHFTSGLKDDGSSILKKLARVDYLGAITLIATICLFLFGLSSPKILLTPIIISVILLISFVLIELYVVSEPIVPIAVLRSRGALLSCLAQLGIMTARWSILIYAPQYAIAVRGWSPASAGSMLFPTNFGFATGGVLAGAFHIKRSGSFWLPSLIAYICFALSIFFISQISTQTTPTILYMFAVFVNGLCIGSALNYTLAHLLHLTAPSTHFISTSLLATFRGFAGSFSAAIGGGLFIRVLKTSLEQGFQEHELQAHEDLIKKLLGSPALVKKLKGMEKVIALEGYEVALRSLFMAASALALVMVLVQACTGWKEPIPGEGVEKEEWERMRGENGVLGPEDEEWEEGMEQGV